MINYYTSIILLSCLSLSILCVLVYENNQISKADKHRYYVTYVVIALSAFMEWAGIQLNGKDIPVFFLRFVKCCDYILTPMAGGALIAQLKIHNRWNNALIGILITNALFQIISFFTGWMLLIDDQNRYSHGPLYPVYIFVYLAIIAILIIQCLIFGKSFRRQNRFSLYAIIGLAILGIAMQEITGGEIRTSYISLAIGALLMFIHFTDFSQQTTEDHLQEQQMQISTDALTGLLSRHAYSETLKKYSDGVPKDLAAFSIDINGLKTVNDTLGHEAGDELICGAAECIKRVFGENGKCYRTGGDEFIVLALMDHKQAADSLTRLKEEASRWQGINVKRLSLSLGYALAADHEKYSCEMLIREADMAMYEMKKKYYSSNGHDRRKP